jgi:hypothetical protein
MKMKLILGFALVLGGCATIKQGHEIAGTCNPCGWLILSGRTLYGTTASDSAAWGRGGGAVFKVNTDGTGFDVLHHFPQVAYRKQLLRYRATP